jgi:hypothetical protein
MRGKVRRLGPAPRRLRWPVHLRTQYVVRLRFSRRAVADAPPIHRHLAANDAAVKAASRPIVRAAGGKVCVGVRVPCIAKSHPLRSPARTSLRAGSES